MSKLMNFDAHTREVFENDEAKFAAFNKLMLDAANGSYEEGIDAKSANDKIISMFKKIILSSMSLLKLEILISVIRMFSILRMRPF